MSRALLDVDEQIPTETIGAGQAVVLPNQMATHSWRRFWSPPSSPTGQIFVVGDDSLEAMLAAVGARRGVAVVSESVSRYHPEPGVAFVPLNGLKPYSVEVAILRSRRVEPLIKAVRHAVPRSPGEGGRN